MIVSSQASAVNSEEKLVGSLRITGNSVRFNQISKNQVEKIR